MYQPDLQEYLNLKGKFTLVPVYREYLADMETPISVFKKLRRQGPCFLLESVEGGEHLARYSFIGLQPFLIYKFAGGRGQITCSDCQTLELSGHPLQLLEEIIQCYSTPDLPELPRFTSGGVGYFSYELAGYLENLPHQAPRDTDIPTGQYMFPGVVVAFDQVKHTLSIIVNQPGGLEIRDGKLAVSRSSADDTGDYRRAVELIENIAGLIFNGSLTADEPTGNAKSGRLTSNMSAEEYYQMVQKAKDYIRAGDIFQVVPSQRFSIPYTGDSFQVYRRLRNINPSPYLYYLDFGDPVLVGSSPEMLIRVEAGMIQTRPIAGTRPRGQDAAADEKLTAELLADEKEKAEHLMLVDLGRNDLGRVCAPGTVQVAKFMQVERYSHVMHLVSEVHGQLAPGVGALTALGACFPAGTVSGAPKIRAMEIIDEIEPVGRDIYSGIVGYIDFSGNLDTAIAIRTIVIHRGHAYIQAGGGVVADSSPEGEYRESLNKARALMQALELGVDGGRAGND